MKRSGRLSYHLCRLLLGAFFVYAGALKISDAPSFAGQIAGRDRIDSGRAVGPLVRPHDAVYMDTSDMSFEEVVGALFDAVMQRARA